MESNIKKVLLIPSLLLLFVLIFVSNVIYTHDNYTVHFPGGNDSIPRYAGAQAWLFEGINPYSEEVTNRAQKMVYGRLARPDEDQQRFVYPFYVIFFYLPLAFFSWEWAQAIGMVILEFSIILITIFSIRLHKWSPPPWMLVFLLIWSVTWYHAVRTIIVVQFAGISALLIVIGLWAVKEKRDILAGVALALASAKPQMLFLLLPLIGMWSILTKRWRLTCSLGVTMSMLLGASFLLMPSWASDMQRQLNDYTSYTHVGSPLNILTVIIFPELGKNVERGLIAFLLIWLLWEWWQVRLDQEGKPLDWVIALTLVITNMVATRTATTNYIMMVPALFLIYKSVIDRFGNTANGWIVLVQTILLVGTWLLFAITVNGNAEEWQMFLPLPLGLLTVLPFIKPKRHTAQPTI